MINQTANNTPRGWRTLSLAIPRGHSDDVAAFIGRAVTTVRRWRQPIINGSGESSFLDTFYSVSAALHHYHRPGLRILEHAIFSWFRRLDSEGVGTFDGSLAAAEITKESTDFVIEVLQRGTPEEQERELEELIATASEHLARLKARRPIVPVLREAKR